MDTLLDLGISLVLFLQGLGDWLETPMVLLSFLGDEEFFLTFMPAIYWCISAGMGLRVGAILLLSVSINGALKMAFVGPRPFLYSPQVRAMDIETTFGIPSGHSQNSAAVWGMMAAFIRRPWAWGVAVTLVFLIGVSRMYLGMHFPTDLLLGWAVGALMVWGFVKLEAPITRWLMDQSLPNRLLTALAVTLILILAGFAIKLSLAAWVIPTSWTENWLRALPGVELPDHLALSGIVTGAAAFFGLAVGALLLHERGGFDTAGVWWKRILRYPIGIVGVLLFWYGLKLIFPDGETVIALVLRFVRYFLVGIWTSYLAPLLFIRIGLAAKPGIEADRIPISSQPSV